LADSVQLSTEIEKTLLPIIDLIYQSVEDVSLWGVILESLAETVRSNGTVLFGNLPGTAPTGALAQARMEGSALMPYAEHFADINILSQRCDEIFAETAVRYSDAAITNSEFEATEFYNDYFRHYDWYHAVGLKVPVGGGMGGYIAATRPKRDIPFGSAEGGILAALFPHVQRALKLYIRFSELRSGSQGMQAALDAMEQAVFGINQRGRAAFLNAAAERMIREGDGVRLANGRIGATDPQADAELSFLIQSAAATGSGAGTFPGRAMFLPRRQGKPLPVLVTPVTRTLLPHHGTVVALVFISRSDAQRAKREAVLSALYRLSPAETRLANLLWQGFELRQAAELMRITYNSARSLLKQIFQKTDVSSQSALIRLLISLPPEGQD
jgi:DNA-binding CsgD family transcriptional regulator